VLIKYLPRDIEPTADDESALRRLAGRLGEWPLLLNIFGGVLREEVVVNRQSLKAALAYVSEGLDTEGLAVFGRDDAGRNAALDASMAVSLRGFSDAERVRLYELAAFPDDGMVSELAALTLWHGTGRLSNFEGKKLLRRLSGGFTTPEPNGAFRIHDKLKEYLGGKLGREALRDTQVKLIDAWGDPHALPDDYAWRNYAYHLIEAGKPEALHVLLLDYTFLQAKLNATDVSTLVADCNRLPGDDMIRLLHSALTISTHAISQDKTLLAAQLHGRLYRHADHAQIAVLRASCERIMQLIPVENGFDALLPAGGALMATLAGHTSQVNGALELTDGRLLSWSGSPFGGYSDNTRRLWAADGAPLTTLAGHTSQVNGALELTDGRLLSWSGSPFGGYSDNTLLLLWGSDGAPLAALIGHTNWVNGALELADGRLLSWSGDTTLRLWAADGVLLTTLAGHTGGVHGALELDDKRLLSWSEDGTLRLWAADGTLLTTLAGDQPGERRAGGQTAALVVGIPFRGSLGQRAATMGVGRRSVGGNDRAYRLGDRRVGASRRAAALMEWGQHAAAVGGGRRTADDPWRAYGPRERRAGARGRVAALVESGQDVAAVGGGRRTVGGTDRAYRPGKRRAGTG